MGDTIATIGIFSDEANKQIEEKTWLRKTPLTPMNKHITSLTNELLFGLYNLTMD